MAGFLIGIKTFFAVFLHLSKNGLLPFSLEFPKHRRNSRKLFHAKLVIYTKLNFFMSKKRKANEITHVNLGKQKLLLLLLLLLLLHIDNNH